MKGLDGVKRLQESRVRGNLRGMSRDGPIRAEAAGGMESSSYGVQCGRGSEQIMWQHGQSGLEDLVKSVVVN